MAMGKTIVKSSFAFSSLQRLSLLAQNVYMFHESHLAYTAFSGSNVHMNVFPEFNDLICW